MRKGILRRHPFLLLNNYVIKTFYVAKKYNEKREPAFTRNSLGIYLLTVSDVEISKIRKMPGNYTYLNINTRQSFALCSGNIKLANSSVRFDKYEVMCGYL